MKKKTGYLLAAVAAGMFSQAVQADSHTVSAGYAQSKVQDFKNLRGVNLQYRYEWDSPFSVVGSFSYMKADDSYSELDNYNGEVSGYTGRADVKYTSLLAGPAYRINDYVSLYALAGLAHTKVDDKTTWTGGYSEEYSSKKTSFAYGAGVAVNPVKNVAVNIGYEGTRVKYDDTVSVNGFNISVGYRF